MASLAVAFAEAEAQNGIFAADDVTYEWYAAKGFDIGSLPYPRVVPGENARYEIDEELSLTDVTPMIAKPFSPGNAFPAEQVARERLQFDKALIGSCTNGSYDDLLQAALVIHAARAAGFTRSASAFVVFPGSGGVGRQIERSDPRLGGESIAEVFRSRTRDEWRAFNDEHDCCIEPILDLDEALGSDLVTEREMVIELEQPHMGTVRQLGVPVKMSRTPGTPEVPAPALGEHTREVLSESGFSEEEIDGLMESGAVAGPAAEQATATS